MYTQFFGNYLLSRKAVTSEQLMEAICEQSSAHIKLGTLAIHLGYMTASEVEEIVIKQTHEDSRFGDLAIANGYLTEAQVKELIESQNPDYLLLGQILIEKGYLSHADFETLLLDYQSETDISEAGNGIQDPAYTAVLLQTFLKEKELRDNENVIQYLSLLFNNLVRFIGSDFTPMDPIPCEEIPACYCVVQKIQGSIEILSGLDLDEETAIAFASHYVGDTLTEFDEYVKASLEDFLNLHNGLYNVNMSNENSIELQLTPPELVENDVLKPGGKSYIIPIAYSFGVLTFILSF